MTLRDNGISASSAYKSGGGESPTIIFKKAHALEGLGLVQSESKWSYELVIGPARWEQARNLPFPPNLWYEAQEKSEQDVFMHNGWLIYRKPQPWHISFAISSAKRGKCGPFVKTSEWVTACWSTFRCYRKLLRRDGLLINWLWGRNSNFRKKSSESKPIFRHMKLCWFYCSEVFDMLFTMSCEFFRNFPLRLTISEKVALKQFSKNS